MKGLESCVVLEEWSVPIDLHHTSSSSTAELDTVVSTIPCPDLSSAEDAVLSHNASSVQPSDRRSSRFDVQVKAKTDTGTGTGGGTGAGKGTGAVEGPFMRRLAEDFMYVPTKIPDYRCVMPVLHPA